MSANTVQKKPRFLKVVLLSTLIVILGAGGYYAYTHIKKAPIIPIEDKPKSKR